MTFSFLRFGGFLLCVAPVAAAQAVVHFPRWSTTDTQHAFPSETGVRSPYRTWDDTTDGGALVFSGDFWNRLRRLSADGAQQWEYRRSSSNTYLATVRDDRNGGAYLMFTRNSNVCHIERIGSNGVPLWQKDHIDSASPAGACNTFHVLPDGSIIAVSANMIGRIDPDGTTRWARFVPEVPSWTYVSASALSPSGVVWLATKTLAPNGTPYESAALRFDIDGNRLGVEPFACNPCEFTSAIDIAVRDDGSAFVSGAGGIGPSRFPVVARFDADGHLNYVVAHRAKVGQYDRVVSDDAGRVYVMSIGVAAHRIDPDDGHVMWSVLPGDIHADDDGLLVAKSYDSSSQVDSVVTRYDVDGAQQWSRPVASGRGYVANWKTTPRGPTLMMDGASGDCGSAPRIVTFSGSGDIEHDIHACDSQISTYGIGVDALAGVGSLTLGNSMLVSRHPDGSVRWSYGLCDWCWAEQHQAMYRTYAARLRDDGGAWVIKRRFDPSFNTPPSYADRIDRIDGSGTVVASAPVVAVPSPYGRNAELVDGPGDVVALMPIVGGVEWQRVADSGAVLGARRIAIECSSFPCDVESAYRLADGGTVFFLPHWTNCAQGQPCLLQNTAIRLAADGTEIRRYGSSPTMTNSAATLTKDGTLYLVFELAGTTYLQVISADGVESTPIALPGAECPYPCNVKGPVDGMLAVSLDIQGGARTVAIRVSDGAVLATAPYVLPITQATRFGFLGNQDDYVDYSQRAWLFHSVTLEPTTQFHLANDAAPASHPPTFDWKVLDDGTIYVVDTAYTSEPMMRMRTSTFVVPGSHADDTLFRSGFE